MQRVRGVQHFALLYLLEPSRRCNPIGAPGRKESAADRVAAVSARFGFDFPPFGGLADPTAMAAIGTVAEEAGWDGVFVWDHIMYRAPVTHVGDPWIGLAAIAGATRHVAIGVMVTPLPRRRPQVVARQSAGIDRISGGRFVLGAGLGLDRSGRELSAFGEDLDDKRRAAMLDESLTIIDSLWGGEPVSFSGNHYLVDDVVFRPRPVTRPRPPIWLAARWPYRNPMKRAARWDGLFLIDMDSPDQLAAAAELVAAERGHLDGFDLVTHLPADEDPVHWIDAGATWIMTRTPYDVSSQDALAVARSGPFR